MIAYVYVNGMTQPTVITTRRSLQGGASAGTGMAISVNAGATGIFYNTTAIDFAMGDAHSTEVDTTATQPDGVVHFRTQVSYHARRTA